MAEGLNPGAEFCRIVDCQRLGRSIEVHSIEADAGERMALSDRLDLQMLDRLSARIGLSRTSDGLVKLQARFEASYAQNCVVTLEPVHQELDEGFELFFKEIAESNDSGNVEVPIEDELSPEPFGQGRIDIGEAITQQLALALDPYPRAPGAVFEAAAEHEIEVERASPLAEIGDLVSPEREEDSK